MNYNDLLKYVPEDKIAEAKELADKISQEAKDNILKQTEKTLAEKAEALKIAKEHESNAKKLAEEKLALETNWNKEKSAFEAEKASLRIERNFLNYTGDELEFAKMKVQNEVAKGAKEEDAIAAVKESMKKMFSSRQDLPPMGGTVPASAKTNDSGKAQYAFDSFLASINPEAATLMGVKNDTKTKDKK